MQGNFPVVAIVGMCGAGKTALTKYFVQKGWQCVYFGGVVMDELAARSLPKNEENERSVREELRRLHGPQALAKLLLPKIRESRSQAPTVLDGLYSWTEYKHLRENLGDDLLVLAIVTNSRLRHQRLAGRKVRPLTAQQAAARDWAEIENLEKGGPIAIADYYIVNNGGPGQLRRAFARFYEEIMPTQEA